MTISWVLGGSWPRNSDSTQNFIARTGWKCPGGFRNLPKRRFSINFWWSLALKFRFYKKFHRQNRLEMSGRRQELPKTSIFRILHCILHYLTGFSGFFSNFFRVVFLDFSSRNLPQIVPNTPQNDPP